MIVIPALELVAGKVVKAGSDKVVAKDPLGLARELRRQGAVYLHLQDRDSENSEVLSRFAEDMVPFQMGGPGCTPDELESRLAAGADRVVVPGEAFADDKQLKALAKQHGVRMLVGLTLDGMQVARAEGETEELGAALARLHKAGVRSAVLRPTDGQIGDAQALQAALDGAEVDVFLWCAVDDQEKFAALRQLAEHGLRGVLLDQELCAKVLELAQSAV